MKNITRLIALPVLSAGIIGGAALGLAGTASAATSTPNTDGSSIVAPGTKSHDGQQMHPYKKRHRDHFNQQFRK